MTRGGWLGLLCGVALGLAGCHDDGCGEGHGHHRDDDDDEACEVARDKADAAEVSLLDAADAVDAGGDAVDAALDVSEPEPSWTLFGEVSLAAGVALEDDGRGTVYVALLETCGAWSSARHVWHVAEAEPGLEAVGYFFEVAPGEWYLAAFLDDDGDADSTAPRPSSGDVALRNASDATSCLRYALGSGRGVIEQDLELDAVVP